MFHDNVISELKQTRVYVVFSRLSLQTRVPFQVRPSRGAGRIHQRSFSHVHRILHPLGSR